MAILYRYAEYKNIDVAYDNSVNISGFSDADKVSGWALDAMKWANGSGLIYGISDTVLSPDGFATRAQLASILQRFAESNK